MDDHVPASTQDIEASNAEIQHALPNNVESEAQTPQPSVKGPSTNDDDLHRTLTYNVSSQGLFSEAVFVTILSMSQLLTQAGLGQVIAPLHIIGASFGTDNAGQLSWFPAAYSLTVGTFILIAGRFGDLLGHKRCWIFGFVWYAIWSLAAGCCVYSNQEAFDICRALQGIGPAFVLPNSIAIIGRAYEPGTRQDMVFAIYGATAPSGFLLGAAFSSLVAQRAWWPWAFWLMAIVCLAVAVAGSFIIPSPQHHERLYHSIVNFFSRLDWLGCVTGVIGLVLFNLAWNQGPVAGWPTPYVYILLILGVIFFGAFVVVETKVSEYPLVELGKLSRDTLFVLGCISAGWACFGIWIYYIYLFEEVLRGSSPLLATAHFVPIGISGLCAAVTTGKVLSKIPASMVMLIALLAFTIGTVLMATCPVDQIYWAQTFVATIIMPWGMDMSFPAATIILSRELPREQQGVAASLVNTFINYSISIGLGMAGTVESHVNRNGTDLLLGYRGAWYLGIGLAGLGVMSALLMAISQFTKRSHSTETAQNEKM